MQYGAYWITCYVEPLSWTIRVPDSTVKLPKGLQNTERTNTLRSLNILTHKAPGSFILFVFTILAKA